MKIERLSVLLSTLVEILTVEFLVGDSDYASESREL